MVIVKRSQHSLCFQSEMGMDGLEMPSKAPPQPLKCKATKKEAAVAVMAIFNEAIHQMPEKSPISCDLINILVTGFNNGKNGTDISYLEGLDTKDIIGLLRVSKSAISHI